MKTRVTKVTVVENKGGIVKKMAMIVQPDGMWKVKMSAEIPLQIYLGMTSVVLEDIGFLHFSTVQDYVETELNNHYMHIVCYDGISAVDVRELFLEEIHA